MAEDSGILGSFGMIGTGVTDRIFTGTGNFYAVYNLSQGYLLAPVVVTPSVPGLSLDWVQHAWPFAWVVTNYPNMLSLDWAKSSAPFATNLADLNPEPVVLEGAVQFRVNAKMTFGGGLVDRGQVEFEIKSTVTAKGNITLNGQVTFSVKATASVDGATRPVKPCEFPGPVLNLRSNLPYGVWQNNPDARFTWNQVFVCDRYTGSPVLVDGYLWKMTKDLPAEAWYDWAETTSPNKELDLNQVPPYGTGSWWFCVAAVNTVAIGPMSVYNVRYNHQPGTPGVDGMWINGLDSLYKVPVVAYRPVTPHVFTWSGVTDTDGDNLTYELEVWDNPTFQINPDTANGRLFFADSLTSATANLTSRLEPGRYFWRVRANDGNELSGWSPTASFIVNMPPLRPTESGVIKVF